MVLFEENMLYYKLDLYLDRIFSDLQKTRLNVYIIILCKLKDVKKEEIHVFIQN